MQAHSAPRVALPRTAVECLKFASAMLADVDLKPNVRTSWKRSFADQMLWNVDARCTLNSGHSPWMKTKEADNCGGFIAGFEG